ncbi:hypothetical protein GCM10027449_04200 [Sinomonas notoginsengisoli]|uniref:hypothetical protein n=1 Tax=Sinomonas notoginsengisoli TaxID=1457311 RepID=UPI001F1DA2F5|nr:hypothetical protein [Sinomonas notoginsengisoli]
MVPSVPHQGPLDPTAGGERSVSHTATPTWRRTVTAAGVILAVVSLVAWAVILGAAAAGGSEPTWVGALALYGLPAAFLLMGVAIAGAVIERRRR